jgi:competence protein ComEA
MLLRRLDQLTVGVLLAAALVLLACHWLQQRARHGQMLHFERVEPVPVPLHIDINRADWPELTLLPDVGETLARRIVRDRAVHGAFRDASDVQRVPGIGPRTLQRLRPFLEPVDLHEAVAGDGIVERAPTD